MSTPQGPVLAASTEALELGNWPAVRSGRARDEVSGQAETMLVVVQEMVAAAMLAQTVGHLLRARDLLHHAARLLPAAHRRRAGGDRWFAVLLPEPPGRELEWWIWATARTILREQAGLAELEARFAHRRAGPRDALVAAFVEYLRWIECDPFVHVPGADVRGVPFSPSRADLLRRATRLWRLAEPRTADISTSVWDSLGGHPGVWRLAMVALAAEDGPVPRVGAGRLPDGVPVRVGREAAYWLARRCGPHLAA